MDNLNLEYIESLLAYHAFIGEHKDIVCPLVVEYINEKTILESSNLLILTKVKEFYEEYKTIPTLGEIKSYIVEEEDVKRLADYLKRAQKLSQEKLNRKVLLTNIEEFFRQRLIKDVLDESFIKNTSGENLIIEEVYDSIEEAMNISLMDDIGLNLFENIEEYINELTSEKNTISTGYRWLDDQLGGGLQARGAVLYNLVAPSNVGKSNFIKAIACNMSKSGYNVLVVSLEMPRYIYANRFVSDMSGINIGRLREEAEDVGTFLVNAKGEGYGSVVIKDFATGSLTSNALGAYIRRTQQTLDIEFDAVFVDYPELMKPTRNFGNRHDLMVANLYVEVRALSFYLEKPFVVVAQLNREGYNKENPSMEDIGGSIGIVQCSDWCGFLFATDDMKSVNQVGLSVGKSRFGAVNQTKRYNVCPDTLAITESSVDHELSPIDLDETIEEISPEDYFDNLFGEGDIK